MTKIVGVDCDAECGNTKILPFTTFAEDHILTDGWYMIVRWENSQADAYDLHACSPECMAKLGKKLAAEKKKEEADHA